MTERKAPEPEPEATAPLWVVTYGDLVSLLVTFFVLLYTFSSLDVEEFRRVQGSLIGAKGLMTDQKQSKPDVVEQVAPADIAHQLDGRKDKPRRNELETKEMLKLIQTVKMPVDPQFEALREGGLRIRLTSDRLFLPGNERISSDGADTIREVGMMFRSFPVRFVVEGHTDDRTYRDGGYGSPRELTSAMAQGVARVLHLSAEVPMGRIGICSRGDLIPLESNRSSLGRQKNRRIEIVVSMVEGG